MTYKALPPMNSATRFVLRTFIPRQIKVKLCMATEVLERLLAERCTPPINEVSNFCTDDFSMNSIIKHLISTLIKKSHESTAL